MTVKVFDVITLVLFYEVILCKEMAAYKVEAIPGGTTLLGEGPHWDIRRQSLYYVDIYNGLVIRYDHKEDKIYKCKVDDHEMVSFIIPINNTEKFAIGIGKRVGVIEWDGRSENCKVQYDLFEVEPEPEKDQNRFNDGKADPRGRLFAGTMRLEILGEDLFENRRGSFYRYDSSGNVKTVLTGIGISNGLTWNIKTKKMFYIDSVALNVTAYDYNIETGDISNPNVLIDFKDNESRPNFVPDGMTIDKDGFLYVATYGGSKIFKINSTTGKIVSEILFPCEQITSAAFGGPNLDILYVTTSKMGNKLAPAGELFKVTGLGVHGLPMDPLDV